jgi:flagellar motor switch protein FliM
VKPMKGPSLFSIDAALLSSLVDSYYGGSGRVASRDPERGLTPSELRFGQLLLKQIFTDMKQAWTSIAALEIEVLKHESNPTFVDIAAPGDGVIVNRFLVETAGGAGTIDFIIPESALAPLQAKMNGTETPAGDSAHWRAVLSEHVKNTNIEVRCLMAETRMNLRELTTLKPGDVIPVDAPGPATLLVGRVPVYSGKFGISRGRNALKLTSPIPVRPGKPGA